MQNQIENLARLIASSRGENTLITKQDRDAASAIVADGWSKPSVPRGGW